jgi:hypothetical protein
MPCNRSAGAKLQAKPRLTPARSFRDVRTPGAVDSDRLSCEHRRTLRVILLGFENGRAGRMAAQGQQHAALSRCGELLGVRASAAAAVGFRTKASGRRVAQGSPRARRARFLLSASALPLTACAVTRRQARGALRAPLKT